MVIKVENLDRVVGTKVSVTVSDPTFDVIIVCPAYVVACEVLRDACPVSVVACEVLEDASAP